GQLRRPGVIRADQKLRAGREVIEHVLLSREAARQMPILAVLATAAQVCHGDNAALVKPDARGRIELGFDADAVSTITREESWILAVEPRAFLANDTQRNLGAILGR